MHYWGEPWPCFEGERPPIKKLGNQKNLKKAYSTCSWSRRFGELIQFIIYLFIYRYNDIEVIFSLTQSDNRYTKNRYNDIEVIFSQSDNRYTKN